MSNMDKPTGAHKKIKPPFSQSYWVRPGVFLAGCYPGAPDKAEMTGKLEGLTDLNISLVVNLMEADEVDHAGRPFVSYEAELKDLAADRGYHCRVQRFPIQDLNIPDKESMVNILNAIDEEIDAGGRVYVHCWGGRGRTGTAVGCWLIRHGYADAEDVLQAISDMRSRGRSVSGRSPETMRQASMVFLWRRGE